MGFKWIFVIEWDETKDYKPKNRKIIFAKELTANDDENRKRKNR